MQSVKTGTASTHGRGSDDSHPVGAGTRGGGLGFTFNNWHGFAGESTFLFALGLFPFKDTWYSNSTATPLNVHAEDYLGHEPRPFTHALVSALGGGGVAPGDPVGTTDQELVMLTCMANGVLPKPTVPAMYIDRVWGGDASVGETAVAMSCIGEICWRLVSVIDSGGFRLSPADIGLATSTTRHVAYAYCGPRPLTRSGCSEPTAQGLQSFGGAKGLGVPAWNASASGPGLEAQFFVVAPVLPGGWVLLGEWPKLVAVSQQRFVSVESTAAALEVQVSGSAGEVVPLLAATEGTMQTHLARCDFRADGTMRARWEAGAAGAPASCQ